MGPEAVPVYASLLQRSGAGHANGSSAQIAMGAMIAMGGVMVSVVVLAFTGAIESCIGLLGRCPVAGDDEPCASQAAKGGHHRGRPSEVGSRSGSGAACLALPHVKRGWQPTRLYTGPLPEGQCVFRLPVAALLRRDRGERHLPEASGKLAFRAATLGTEGWPLVIFVGTGHMPSATVGPALQDTPVAGPRSLELRGSDGSHYGVLDPQGAGAYVVSCGGRPVLSVEGGPGGRLSVTSGEGVPLAEVRGAEEGEPPEAAPEETTELRIFEGTADPVLVVIGVLSVLLFGSPREADPRPRPKA